MDDAGTGYDIVIAGGGTAGCVLAARLSEDDRCRVLLLEAGPDHPARADLPPDVADAREPTTGHDWGYAAEPDEAGRSVALPRGRLVGGCSSTNAAFFVHAWAADFDGWAALGNKGWSYEELLPFVGVEAAAGGPMPVAPVDRTELSDAQRAFGDAAVAAGHAPVTDHNRPGSVGAGLTPRNAAGGLRVSTSLAYLEPARGRANLTVRPGALVDRVEVVGGRAAGVRLAGGELVAADRVVLAAGAYGSPAVLLRSGIGPAADLTGHQIDVLADLPGVGANLADHPLASVDLPVDGGFDGAKFQVLVTMRSSLAPPDGPPDLHLFAAGPWAGPAAGAGGVLAIVCGLVEVRSRGSVRLRSADPADSPRIDVAHLRDPADLARLEEGLAEARRIAATPPLARLVRGGELDSAPLRERVGTYHHPVGTCAMGPDPAAGAVVDARGAVHGLAQLWVADASVMPAIPHANTMAPTIVVAERIAAWLRSG